MANKYRRQGQEHLLQQAGLAAAAVLGVLAFAGLLLLLPVCWMGLAGPAGHLVSAKTVVITSSVTLPAMLVAGVFALSKQ
jgi:uncharacterized membrane protein YkgB